MFKFDLTAKSSRSKKGLSIADYLKSRKIAIPGYLDIMRMISSGISPLDKGFQNLFSQYYGLNASRGMNKKNFYIIFDEYYKTSIAHTPFTYENILNDLADPIKGTGRVEKSFGSKLLYTLKPYEPIVDSVVLKNLRNDVDTAPYFTKLVKIKYTVKDAVDLFDALKKCYYELLIPEARKTSFFSDFNKEFPTAAGISDVKKIDFYLWAL